MNGVAGPSAAAGGPLSGLLVVALEQAVAAPLCTRHLGDLGARVVKIENRDGGDFTRDYDESVRGMSAAFVWLNRNKESVTLDLKHPAGRDLLDRLLCRADVFVQNLAPGAAARLGLDAASLVAVHPRIVAVDMSGYGEGGPLEHKRSYDLLVQAEAGSCSVTGVPGAYAKPGIPVADVGSAMYAYSSILAALYQRELTGRGTAISVSMMDTIAEWMGPFLHYTLHTGEERQPNGISSPTVAPYGSYPTSDQQTVVLGTTNDREWQRLATELLGRPDLAADPRFGSNDARCRLRAELDAVIAAWTCERTLEAVQRLADAAGIGNARLNTVRDVLDHPQLTERGRWHEVDSPVGPVPVLATPPVSPSWATRMEPIPGLGEHTDALLAELGCSADDIRALHADEVV